MLSWLVACLCALTGVWRAQVIKVVVSFVLIVAAGVLYGNTIARMLAEAKADNSTATGNITTPAR
jgi:hypothetical protein